MKAIVKSFGAIPQKVYLVTDEIAEKYKEMLEKKAGIITQEDRENRAMNGKEEFYILDTGIISKELEVENEVR